MECQRRKLVYETLEESHGPIFALEFIAKFWNVRYCVCAQPQSSHLSMQEPLGRNTSGSECRAVMKLLSINSDKRR